jgi:hypothetical protein
LSIPGFSQTPVGPPNQILCNKTASVSVASATTTSVITGTTTTTIFLCGWHVTSANTATSQFQFEYGTQGGPCSTPTTFTPPFSITSTAPSADHVDYAQFSAPLGAQVCVVTTGTTNVQVLLWYNQF